MNFTNDPYGLKAVGVFIGIIVIGMILWDVIGFSSGGGGTPFGLFE